MASLNLHDFTGAEAMRRPRIQSHFSFIPFHFLHSLHKPSLLSPHVCHVYPNVILPLTSFVPSGCLTNLDLPESQSGCTFC